MEKAVERKSFQFSLQLIPRLESSHRKRPLADLSSSLNHSIDKAICQRPLNRRSQRNLQRVGAHKQISPQQWLKCNRTIGVARGCTKCTYTPTGRTKMLGPNLQRKILSAPPGMQRVHPQGRAVRVHFLRKLGRSGRWEKKVVNFFGEERCTQTKSWLRL